MLTVRTMFSRIIEQNFFFFSDKYGFVTFAEKLDAYKAVEHGNDEPHHPKYDLSFGGRRLFCGTLYSDLGEYSDNFSVLYSNHYIKNKL